MKSRPARKPSKPPAKPKVRDLSAAFDDALESKLAEAEAAERRGDGRSTRAPGFQPERGANTRDAQIAIGKFLGLSNAQIAAAVATAESPSGVSEGSVLRRLKVNAEWIEEIVQWALRIKRKSAAATAAAASGTNADITASNLRQRMEKKLPQAFTILEGAIDEGNLEMAIYVIEQVIGKANQTHTMLGHLSVEHVWKGREELLGQERDMVESEKMLKMLPAASVDALNDIPDAELVATE